MKVFDYVDWDKIGISLSFLCGIHCLLTPFIILSIPMMARYYLAHPFFHILMALLIIPVGVFAFVSGYKHHKNKKVFFYGFPGLFIMSFAPMAVHLFRINLPEYPIMILGSALLICAHWMNRRSCSCQAHSH